MGEIIRFPKRGVEQETPREDQGEQRELKGDEVVGRYRFHVEAEGKEYELEFFADGSVACDGRLFEDFNEGFMRSNIIAGPSTIISAHRDENAWKDFKMALETLERFRTAEIVPHLNAYSAQLEKKIGQPKQGPFPSAYERAKESAYKRRGIEVYLDIFNLKKEDLEGKTVLDLGSGKSEFARDVEAQGLSARVISLDAVEPRKEDEEEWSADRVIALAQHLPFQKETFDVVLASHSVPLWIFGDRKQKHPPGPLENFPEEDVSVFRSEMKRIFDEVASVLKERGRALFAPNEVYYGRESNPTDGSAPASLFGKHHWELMKALEDEIKKDERRSYEVFTEPRGTTGIIHLVKGHAARSEESPTAPPDTRVIGETYR